MKTIQQIVDEALERMRKDVFPMMTFYDNFPQEMVDESIECEDQGYFGWKPIPSTISNDEIAQLESDLNCKLPKSYKVFLQYLHFAELYLDDIAIGFPKNLPSQLPQLLKERNEYYDGELVNNGYFQFADFHDYGLLVFDTNKPIVDNEFEVLYIDHEEFEDKFLYAKNFTELMNYDAGQSNRFIEFLNTKRKSR